MADEDRLSSSLQESILTLLCFDEKHGAQVVGLLAPEHFEEPYNDIAGRALDYRKRYGKAPGAAHIDDLFDHVLGDSKNKRAPTYKRILSGLLHQAAGLNPDYILTRVNEFIQRQTIKLGVLEAGNRLMQGGELVSEEVLAILNKTLRTRIEPLSVGTFLSDPRALNFLDTVEDIMPTGIKELEARGVGPARKEMLLFIAPRKRGKSWFVIHIGRVNALHRHRVLHLTLEMSEDRVFQRYFQQLFAVPKRKDPFNQTIFEYDELERVTGFRIDQIKPEISLRDSGIRKYFADHQSQWGARFNKLLVKQFPTKQLTVDGYMSFLDGLDATLHFIPDIVIIDYPDLMQHKGKDPRIALGESFERLRGVAVERNHALVVPTQGNRTTETASTTKSADISEDISKVATADTILTYSQTKDEKQLGLARLLVANMRNDDDGWSVLLSQSYKTGQFLVSSAYMNNNYFDVVKGHLGQGGGED
jgi:hypothetical protein